MPNTLDFLSDFKVGGNSNQVKTEKKETKKSSVKGPVEKFIDNYRKMYETMRQQSVTQPVYERTYNSGSLDNTRFDGKNIDNTINPLSQQFRYAGEETVSNTPANAIQVEPAEAPESVSETAEDDVVEYTYKPGDTFGQVILDLGLDTSKGLWGSDGDVAYYTKQLRDQGIPSMVPIGTKIRLKRRK